MKTSKHASLLACLGAFGLLNVPAPVHAGFGNMSLTTNQVTVVAGEAASYMRAGSDWNGTFPPMTPPNSAATPTLAQFSKITSWQGGNALHFKFEIPDVTSVSGADPLVCGDQIVVQIARPGTLGAANLQPGDAFRYQVILTNGNQATLQLYLPQTVGPGAGGWKNAGEPNTAGAIVSVTGAAPNYVVQLDIPIVDIGVTTLQLGDPESAVGLAIALLNDLGHSHTVGADSINEATGTTFPIGMGLVPASDPVFTCGTPVAPNPAAATGNWTKPFTWGKGFFGLASPAGDVTFDQGPQYTLSRSIRIGRCNVLSFSEIMEVTAANWESVQQNVALNWYQFNSGLPCRMTIWMDAKVTGSGVVNKRFMAVWGRPNIGGQKEWFFVGLTNPVPVSAPNTPVALIWNAPPPANFTGHPCLRVYVLPETLTPQQIAQIQAIDTDDKLNAVVNTIVLPQGAAKSAQMNFSNLASGNCALNSCMPLAATFPESDEIDWPQFAFISSAHAQEPDDRRPDAGVGDDPDRPADGKQPNLVRVIAHGFGIAQPETNRTYSYVESIGQIGYAIPTTMLSAQPFPLTFDVGNPALTEAMHANGSAVEIVSPPRRIFVHVATDVVTGDPVPKIDTSALDRIAEGTLEPGEVVSVEVSIATEPSQQPPPPWWKKYWWVLLILIIFVLLVLFRRRPA